MPADRMTVPSGQQLAEPLSPTFARCVGVSGLTSIFGHLEVPGRVYMMLDASLWV